MARRVLATAIAIAALSWSTSAFSYCNSQGGNLWKGQISHKNHDCCTLDSASGVIKCTMHNNDVLLGDTTVVTTEGYPVELSIPNNATIQVLDSPGPQDGTNGETLENELLIGSGGTLILGSGVSFVLNYAGTSNDSYWGGILFFGSASVAANKISNLTLERPLLGLRWNATGTSKLNPLKITALTAYYFRSQGFRMDRGFVELRDASLNGRTLYTSDGEQPSYNGISMIGGVLSVSSSDIRNVAKGVSISSGTLSLNATTLSSAGRYGTGVYASVTASSSSDVSVTVENGSVLVGRSGNQASGVYFYRAPNATYGIRTITVRDSEIRSYQHAIRQSSTSISGAVVTIERNRLSGYDSALNLLGTLSNVTVRNNFIEVSGGLSSVCF